MGKQTLLKSFIYKIKIKKEEEKEGNFYIIVSIRNINFHINLTLYSYFQFFACTKDGGKKQETNGIINVNIFGGHYARFRCISEGCIRPVGYDFPSRISMVIEPGIVQGIFSKVFENTW